MRNEAKILKKLAHPGIIKLHTTFTQECVFGLVLDYALNSDFAGFLENNTLSAEACQYYTVQLVSTLAYLRQYNYVHRDLKPANMLLNSKF